MRVPKSTVHASRSIIGLLIRRRHQPGDEDVVILLLELYGRIGQNVRKTTSGHLDIEGFNKLTNLRLAHVAAVLQQQDQSLEVTTKVAAIATRRERASIILFLGRRVKDMTLKLSILWLDFDVLHDDDFIIDTHRIGGQCRRINGTLNGLVNRDVFERATVVCPWLLLFPGF